MQKINLKDYSKYRFLGNKRGVSLITILIAASIGLVFILGISKLVINFSDRSNRLNRQSELNILASNIIARLKSVDSWEESIKKSGGKTPGLNAPLKIYKDGKTWLCPKKGGALNEGVILFSQKGELVEDLDCKKCKKKRACGRSEKEFSRVELTATSSGNLIRPTYVGSILDTSGLKIAKPISTVSSQELYDEMQVSCGVKEFLVKVVDGKPVCQPEDIALRGKTCGKGFVLIGFDGNGNPKCNNLNTLIRPFVDNTTNRRIVTDNLNPRNIEIDRTTRDFNRRYSTMGLSGRESEVTGSNFTECALLRRMKCPDGYFMTTYEALQATAGGHCSISCKEFVVGR
jgi:hypothetical protein